MNQTTDATAMFAPLWRRKWLILAVGILVALGTYFYYKREHPNYLATTQVYLGAGAEEQAQIGTSGAGTAKKSGGLEPAAQATLINSAIIKSAAKEQLRKRSKSKAVRAALKGKAKAKAPEKSEFLTISAEAHNAQGAALLANLTAETYVNRENRKYRREVQSALSLTRRQLRRIEASEDQRVVESSASAGKSSKSSSTKSSAPSASETLQAANLSNKINQLEAGLAIVTVRQIDPAKRNRVEAVSSSPKRNGIFGFAIGLLLASLAVYALARFDDRLRRLAEIEAAFQTQILTVLRTVAHPVVHRDGKPTPSKLLRESLQRLHTTLQLGDAYEHGPGQPRTLLFLSADAGDGQSTVLADLALIQSDAGAKVAIVEADFRRPVLAKLLDVSDRPGVAEVLAGSLTLDEAMQDVAALPVAAGAGAAADLAPTAGVATAVGAPAAGSTSILVGATTVANPPALLARPAMGELLRSVAEEFDYTLVDTPPPLEVSDALPLLRLVDGIIIVARVGHTRAASASRLMQLLARTPSAPVLGVVANGVAPKDIKKYGFSAYSGPSWRSRLRGR
jgi:Mrp family chromosome partitioning ATPase/capsular polysaccharide biosynthesis protein